MQRDAKAFDRLRGTDMAVLTAVVEDFYSSPARLSQEDVAYLTDLFCQLFVFLYQQAKRNDAAVADAFLHAFLWDYPGAAGSCVYPQWEALVQASHGFKSAGTNRLLVWQQALRLVQAYNEFLNSVLGHYIVAWRCARGKALATDVFYKPYGLKLKEFSDLTDGGYGPFNLVLRIADPHLRNAIAHENVWLDSDSNAVRYTDGKGKHMHYEMNLMQFMCLAMIGSHLAMAYIAGAAAVAVLEVGGAADVAKLPKHLVKLFHS